jgi:hypothetical protein
MRALCLRWQNLPWFYNGCMRAAPLFTLFLCCLAPGLALAQAPAKAPTASQSKPADPGAGRPEQKIEKIRHEDAGSRIDELRVGGETKSITVKPKGDMPAYELGTEGGNRSPSDSKPERGRGGSPGWKVREF